ncbi:L-amino acid N-acyltransferase YncA [Micromonospora phaseoli]|uniref:L-amino acid N-acyltransferase YncA n=1 Tax=Micromonospora phaseoli TaxID=1144548 RepID=A0A1H7A7P9_9ACTN|nr:GNAT family N-acetyltransferase [Micromonospora phaseoli]PZV97006.1 L-amino acid N-acyltransferase YncA [Micromonospora phaseoli]GIJ77983.1 N-acetyltransferase [Micromonospora phaseoli]SEJ57075.1 L-amino acid N-acyltransferase YncA [Micromonospora phaseoli]
MTVTLRPANADDLMAVGELHQRSRVAAYSSFLPVESLADPTPDAMGRYWTERWSWERADHLMTVAERDGVLAGFSYVGPDDEGDPVTGLLNAIHLEPAERGRGVGRALMIDALASMRSRGRRRAVLWVLRDNTPARRFYERGGWLPTGIEREERIGAARTPQLRYTREL